MFSITFFCHHHHRSCWRDFINAQLWIPSLSPPSSNPYVSLRCCFTFYLSPRRLISPQTAQFLEDHFVKSLGVNFATSMAVKSDWKIPREEIDNEALQLRNSTKHWFIFLQRHSEEKWINMKVDPKYKTRCQTFKICCYTPSCSLKKQSLQFLAVDHLLVESLIALLALPAPARPRLSKHFLRKPPIAATSLLALRSFSQVVYKSNQNCHFSDAL